MSKDVEVPRTTGNPPDPNGGKNSLGGLIATVLSAVSSLYLATNSILVTVIGAVMALIAAVLYLYFGRK